MSFLIKIICVTVTHVSDINVEITAPTDPIDGIIIKFNTTFTLAPTITDLVNFLSWLVGKRYCLPITLLIPINKMIGDVIIINIDTFSNPSPKNHGTKLIDIPAIPIIIGDPIKKTNLNEL